MAILFTDGFDYNANDTAITILKWDGGSSVFSYCAGRFLGTSLGGYGRLTKAISASGHVVVGFAFQSSGRDGTVAVAGHTLSISTAGVLTCANMTGSAQLAGADGNPTWSYVELKVKLGTNQPAGSSIVRVNGSQVLQNSTTYTQAAADNLVVTSRSLSSSVGVYDDLYVADASGSVNNDFLGDVRIETKLPNAEGTYLDYAPSTGTVHFSLVDERTPSNSDFVLGDVVGHKDSYQVADLSTSHQGAILGVAVSAIAATSDAGNKSVAVLLRSGTTDATGPSKALNANRSVVYGTFDAAPGGAVWTRALVNAAEIGTTVTA